MSTKMKKAQPNKREIRKQTLLLGLSFALLAAVILFALWAWFTRLTNVAGMQFDVAQWDFNANNSIDDFYVNVNEYVNVKQGKAAPGTSGTIPLKLSGKDSDTDVEYVIRIDRTKMSEEFQKRIRFYYKDEKDQKQYMDTKEQLLKGTIPVISEGKESVDVQLFWEWAYEIGVTDDEKAKNNEFDTLVGLNPDEYMGDMIAKISISGTQVQPEKQVQPK